MWENLWSFAKFNLHLTDDEFGELTPRQFQALRKRFEQEQEHKDWHFACLEAITVNYSMCRPEKPVKIEDFMPTRSIIKGSAGGAKVKRATKANRKQVANNLKAMFTSARLKAGKTE